MFGAPIFGALRNRHEVRYYRQGFISANLKLDETSQLRKRLRGFCFFWVFFL